MHMAELFIRYKFVIQAGERFVYRHFEDVGQVELAPQSSSEVPLASHAARIRASEEPSRSLRRRSNLVSRVLTNVRWEQTFWRKH